MYFCDPTPMGAFFSLLLYYNIGKRGHCRNLTSIDYYMWYQFYKMGERLSLLSLCLVGWKQTNIFNKLEGSQSHSLDC